MRVNNKVQKICPLPHKQIQKRIENYKEAAKEFELEREMAQTYQNKLEIENAALKAQIKKLETEREFQRTEISILHTVLNRLGVYM